MPKSADITLSSRANRGEWGNLYSVLFPETGGCGRLGNAPRVLTLCPRVRGALALAQTMAYT